MKPLDLVPLILGLGCLVAGQYLPNLSATFQMVGGALIGWAVPQISKWGKPTNTASVIPVAPMETGDAPAKVLPKRGQTS